MFGRSSDLQSMNFMGPNYKIFSIKNIGIGTSKQLFQHQVDVNYLNRKFVRFDVPEATCNKYLNA